ncbi:DNA-3-methyladenine glycosylase, putative [Plasmodium sp. gorilla clade G2]|uniref:DNA-3-methyladenine glycosylase, putative n=1 Tax=Plasmodium sp. gorilla clade G2 TaxID=880535 RepID=UPI000D2041EE|nr:DNA-3-methyladenine glycosylase, putative [Plasmodium sp. gorilla clade G2]SOV19833.1 DNA-3-methyladenine glycosylase, putative [Plasmodium sp. gorilla clade G2]
MNEFSYNNNTDSHELKELCYPMKGKKRKHDSITKDNDIINESKVIIKRNVMTTQLFDDINKLSYVYFLLKYYFDNNPMKILNENFYLIDDVLYITEILIGHILWVFDEKQNKLYGSRIIELESYNGVNDKASHAYNNKKTNRNMSMFEKGGISYVYLCYGIHNCLNIVTNVQNIPDAILVRSTEPVYNIEYFLSNKFEKISQYFLSNSILINKNCKDQQKNNSTPKNKRKQQEHIPNKHDNIINETNYLKKIDELINIFKMIKKKQLIKLCSGPGCVTKSQDITRQDDKQYFYVGTNIGKENNINTKNINNKKKKCSDVQKNSKYFNNNEYPKNNNKICNNIHSDNDCTIDISSSKNENKKRNHCKHEYIQEHINQNELIDCYYFLDNIHEIQKSRFFITLCPSISDIMLFFENINNPKHENEYSYIYNIFNEHKNELLEYFHYMKWDKDNFIVQKDKRIGISYAQEAALYDYRFLLKNHPSVSILPK